MTYDAIGKLDKRVPEITAEVNAGKMVWHKYDCIGCHTIFGNGSYFIDPEAVNPKASMPKFGITAVEADGLLAFFDWPAKVDTNGWPPKPILAGAAGSGGAGNCPQGRSLPVTWMFRLPHDKRDRRHIRARPEPCRKQKGPGVAY